MDMFYLLSNKECKDFNDLELVKEITKPALVALVSFHLVINVLFMKRNFLFIFPTIFFGLISIRYFSGIFYLAIISDRVISNFINTSRLQCINSIFSFPLLPSNDQNARGHILSYCLVMYLIMFSMARCSYELMFEKKIVNKDKAHQVVKSIV